MSLFDHLDDDADSPADAADGDGADERAAPPAAPRAMSVSELTAQIQAVLEETFSTCWVVGEISNFARPQSGHCYLTLKDDRAQLRAALWRATAARLRFDLHDGLEVVCRGRIEVYPPRGQYQLIIDHIEPRGMGALELALRQLHERLSREGLFDPGRKRPLPRFIRRLAVVTSPTGAAIHDFLQVLYRRWQGIEVLIVPTRVQGAGAGEEIAAAIRVANRLAAPPDCLVVTRGGGSLEDLWAFNEEVVVRAIAASAVPVVSAVGHEIDVTLSDLVADLRALTPSEAAERLAPSAEDLRLRLDQLARRLASASRSTLAAAGARVEGIAQRSVFRRPFDGLLERARRLDELGGLFARGAGRRLERETHRLATLAARLESLSPLAVLGRGYSITQRADGDVVRDAAELAVGDALVTRFQHGRARSRVEGVESDGV